jgi:hypothetical protein
MHTEAPVVYVVRLNTIIQCILRTQSHNIMYMYGADQYCCIDDSIDHCETVRLCDSV